MIILSNTLMENISSSFSQQNIKEYKQELTQTTSVTCNCPSNAVFVEYYFNKFV